MERHIGIDTHRDSSTICVLSATGSEAVPPTRPLCHCASGAKESRRPARGDPGQTSITTTP
jgi:hypothetical protein